MAKVSPAEELVAALGLELLRGMWRIRAFEERVGQLTRADEVHGLVRRSSSLNRQRIDPLLDRDSSVRDRFHLHYADLADASARAKELNPFYRPPS